MTWADKLEEVRFAWLDPLTPTELLVPGDLLSVEGLDTSGIWNPPRPLPTEGPCSGVGSCLQSPSSTAQVTVEVVPPNVAEGKEVVLLALKLPEKFSRVDWFRGYLLPANNIVLLRPNPGNITKGPAHSGKETLYSNGSLLIQNLTIGDTGTYYIQVYTVNSDIIYEEGQLHVSELSPKPNIIANNSRPVEQEDSVELTYKPESPNTTYKWFINTQLVKPSTNLKDTGPYECETSNPVSVHHSHPFNLTILYGPDTPTISPSKLNYSLGETLSLSCHTDSNPPAQFSWFLGKKNLTSTQILSISNLSLHDSGSYSCLVSNQATQLNKTAVINIRVSESVAPPSILASNTTVTEGADPVVLTCLTNDTGVSTQWYLNNKDLQPAERRKLSADNRTLTL
ncbi:carcinoembryonic antigen-related cell adhesion molecule 1-like [Suncus etruscus]|uniref:carcinoembryonic antigen-related cell adhesion molecule 1-like n=1 Tax=Suncus etruscus TaxID=109475 RepID=UPI002110840A|nr:carcinoembryonic antigen-related cell adhesion molecule 1-like [Suncus etruscus]